MKLKSVMFTSLVCVALFVSSCATPPKKKTQEIGPDNTGVQQIDSGKNNGIGFDLNGDSDSNKAGALKTVYFDFNSAVLSSDTKEALDNNAKFLKSNVGVKVQVEGHCDERGGVQFNLALGEKRAKGVREYLVSQGIKEGRITIISFGKERPVTFGHEEAAWSKNRRANFLITTK